MHQIARRKKIAHFTPSIISLKTQMDRRLVLLHQLGWDHVGFSTVEHYDANDYVSEYLDFVPSRFLTRRMTVFHDILYFFECIFFLRRTRPDVMMTYGPKPGFYARIAGFFGGVPRRIHVSWGLYYEHESPRLRKYAVNTLDWFASYFCHQVHSQNREDLVVMHSYPFIDTDKFIHVGQGVDLTDTYNPALYKNSLDVIRTKYCIEEQACVFLIAARICRDKGYVELIKAFDQMIEDGGRRIQLLICGAFDQSKGRHTQIDLPPEGSSRKGIHFIGRVPPEDIPEIMAAADVFVLPSFKEGLPRTIAEATAMGMPVITTDSRGNVEAIEHEFNGLIVPAGNVDELRKAMEKLVDSPAMRTEFCRNSRQLALERYDENRLMTIILDAIEGSENREDVRCG